MTYIIIFAPYIFRGWYTGMAGRVAHPLDAFLPAAITDKIRDMAAQLEHVEKFKECLIRVRRGYASRVEAKGELLTNIKRIMAAQNMFTPAVMKHRAFRWYPLEQRGEDDKKSLRAIQFRYKYQNIERMDSSLHDMSEGTRQMDERLRALEEIAAQKKAAWEIIRAGRIRLKFLNIHADICDHPR